MSLEITYDCVPEFEKDFKKLEKRFKTLKDDFENMKKALLEVYYKYNTPVPPKSLVEIKGFYSENYKAIKVRAFSSASLKGRGRYSGIRVTYIYDILNNKIIFIEIYFKGDQENENKIRLGEYLRKYKS